MNKIRNFTYLTGTILILIILIWFIVIPKDLIEDYIEQSPARSGLKNIKLSIEGLHKGFLFNLNASSLNLLIDDRPALVITDLTGRLSAVLFKNKSVAISVNGKIGSGNMDATFSTPSEGKITIERAELVSIPYFDRLGLDIKGHLLSDIAIKNNTVKATFRVPDLSIDDSSTVIPLLNTFKKLQGSLTLMNNGIKIESLSLEGNKGYARIKGNISNGMADLSLELMPEVERLTSFEEMLIGKYIVSPGYYVVPIKGQVQ